MGAQQGGGLVSLGRPVARDQSTKTRIVIDRGRTWDLHTGERGVGGSGGGRAAGLTPASMGQSPEGVAGLTPLSRGRRSPLRAGCAGGWGVVLRGPGPSRRKPLSLILDCRHLR